MPEWKLEGRSEKSGGRNFCLLTSDFFLLFFTTIVLIFPSLVSAKKLKATVLVQPFYEIRPDSSLMESGSGDFDLKRAKITLKGRTGGKKSPSFKLSIDGAKASNYLRNATVLLPLHKSFRLRAGYFKIPFGMETQKGSSSLITINRGRVDDYLDAELGKNRQEGLELYGKPLKMLKYGLAVFDGPNKILPGWEPFELVTGELMLEPVENLSFGVWGMSDVIHRVGKARRIWSGSVGTAWKGKVLRAEVEYWKGDDDVVKDFALLDLSKDYLSSSLRLELAGRFSLAASESGPALRLERTENRNKFSDWMVLGWRSDWENGLSLQFEFSSKFEEQNEKTSVDCIALLLGWRGDFSFVKKKKRAAPKILGKVSAEKGKGLKYVP